MKRFILTMRIEADDDVDEGLIREEVYNAGEEVPFGFDVVEIREVSE